jgi:hypothetical protein
MARYVMAIGTHDTKGNCTLNKLTLHIKWHFRNQKADMTCTVYKCAPIQTMKLYFFCKVDETKTVTIFHNTMLCTIEVHQLLWMKYQRYQESAILFKLS